MIKTLIVGILQENCYLVWDENTKETAVIDPGDDGELIAQTIEEQQLKPKLIINTHYHFDHTGANGYIKDRYNIPIAIGKNDAALLESSYLDAINLMINSTPSPKADILLSDGNVIDVGNYKFEVIETPGHTQGSICLYLRSESLLFSGDTLFFESVGRWDLKGGDKFTLFKSLDKIFRLPQETKVFPGHGQPTTIAHELLENPYKKGVL